MFSRLKLVFILDSVLLLATCTLENVPFTGLTLHEWIALAAGSLILVHMMLSWTWIAATLRRLKMPGSWRARFNYLLNSCLFIAIVLTLFSGIMLSEVVLPRFGIRLASGDIAWRYIHNQFSNYFLILAGLHLALNWDWVSAATRKLLSGDFARGAKVAPRGGEQMTRLVLILAAAAFIVGLAWLAVVNLPALSYEHLHRGFLGFREYQRRRLEPRLSAFPELCLQIGLIVAGAWAARKLFRIHL